MDKQVLLRILVIDDNLAIHQDFIKILANEHKEDKFDALKASLFGNQNHKFKIELPFFQIDTASQGEEGVQKIKQALKEKKPYALAFVDIRMPPGLSGIETIKCIWQLDKDIQIVICTAYSDYTWKETVEELGINDSLLIIKKPFDSIAVRQLACALTKKWQLMQDARNHTDFLEKTVQERTNLLQQSLSITRATLESADNGIIVIDNAGKVVDYNQLFLEMWQIPTSLIETKNYAFIQEHIFKKQGESKLFQEITNRFKSSPENTGIHTINLDDGRYFECYSQPQRIDGIHVGRVWSFRDITNRIGLETKLEYQATHDPLTDLPNRALLIDRIQQEIARSKRNKTMFSVMFIDLDRFKLINDSFSHETGDALLLVLSKRLCEITRAEDTIARLSGDEFIMVNLSPTIYKQQNVINLASKILNEISKVIKIAERNISITASIGISIYPCDGTKADELIRKADLAMYRSKAMGGNQLQFYTDELNDECKMRLEKESDMRQALINNEFFLEYQPQYDRKNNQLIAVEALIRWKHPKYGILLPLDFIPLAEETGLIIPIGEWVIKTACAQNKEWQNKGIPCFRIAINIATKQFMQPNLVKQIKTILHETKLKPEYLEIEVTENVMISNPNVIDTIIELKKLGTYIVLDDFGTGNAGLNYLRTIPIDQLKIDKTFIENIDFNRSDEVIIKAIIAMAGSLDLEVVAEGVETQIQLNFLESQNCKRFQGYYFSKPLKAKALEKILKKQ